MLRRHDLLAQSVEAAVGNLQHLGGQWRILRYHRGDVAHACIGVLEQALDALHYARNGRDSKVL